MTEIGHRLFVGTRQATWSPHILPASWDRRIVVVSSGVACDDDNLASFQAAACQVRAPPRVSCPLCLVAVVMTQADSLVPAEAAEPLETY